MVVIQDDEVRQRLASRVRALRASRVLTQVELAASSGLGRATIARIEGGEVTPHPRTVRAIARALGVDPSSLLEPAPDDAPSTSAVAGS